MFKNLSKEVCIQINKNSTDWSFCELVADVDTVWLEKTELSELYEFLKKLKRKKII